MGRLTADPELKTTNSGISVVRFTVAVDRAFSKNNDERKADFIPVTCWRQTAEFVSRYFNKGSMIAVDGRIQTGSYQAKDGSTRYTTEIVADNVSFTGGRRESESSQDGSNQAYSQAPSAPQAPEASYQSGSNSDFQDMPLDDDLPF